MSAVDEQPLTSDDDGWKALRGYARDIVILLAADGMIRCASPSVGWWLGHQAEELVGQSLAAITHPQDAHSLTPFWDGGEPGEHLALSLRLRARDGSWRSFQSTLVRLRPEPGARSRADCRVRRPTEEPVREGARPRGARAAGVATARGGRSAFRRHRPRDQHAGAVRRRHDPIPGRAFTTCRPDRGLRRDLDTARRRGRRPAPGGRAPAEEVADLEYLRERIPRRSRGRDGIDRVRRSSGHPRLRPSPTAGSGRRQPGHRTTLIVAATNTSTSPRSNAFGELPPIVQCRRPQPGVPQPGHQCRPGDRGAGGSGGDARPDLDRHPARGTMR